ncbi:MAG TPA: class II aldolase/adducin family protein [Spirochaetia bacterium]|nr:class II aldolase/adducin family protein [Spirochaetia bacterium]
MDGLHWEYAGELAACGRRLADAGLFFACWGNLSVRVPPGDSIIITPSGMDYEGLLPADMVRLTPDGRVLTGRRRPSTETGLHLAVYRARPGVGAVIHTHSPAATACAAARAGTHQRWAVPPLTEEMAQVLGGGVPVAAYAPPGSAELGEKAVAALGTGQAVLLANHGVLGTGADLAGASLVVRLVERAALMYLLALRAGGPCELSPAEVANLRAQYAGYGQGPLGEGESPVGNRTDQ